MKKTHKIALTSALVLSTFCSVSAYADQSPWQIRLRGIYVDPIVSSANIPVFGGSVTGASSQFVPEFDINYFFNKHLAAELILATTRHSVTASDTVLGGLDLGKVNLLPPTLTLKYLFLPDCIFNPYIGAGLNYTYFYNVNSGPVANSISYSNSFGPALQAGIDVALNKNWSINFDVKKIFIETTASVTAAGQTVNTHVKLNPFVYGIGVAYRFS